MATLATAAIVDAPAEAEGRKADEPRHTVSAPKDGRARDTKVGRHLGERTLDTAALPAHVARIAKLA